MKKILSKFVAGFCFTFVALAAQAQSEEWLPLTGAENLRNKIVDAKFERQLPKGEISKGEYFTDGTGVVKQYGASFREPGRSRAMTSFVIVNSIFSG